MTEPALPRGHHGGVPPWRDVRVLRVVAQVVALGLIGLLVAWLGTNLLSNMRSSGLSFGFRFLDATAGFEIPDKIIPYNATDTYGQAFLVGLLNTLQVSVIGIFFATILGVVVGVARLSSNWLLSRLAAGYVELMRNTPLLVQLVLIYAILRQLPPVAQSLSLPGSIFLNQRGLYLPRPEVQPGFGLWLASLAVAVAVAVAFHLAARRPTLDERSAQQLRWAGYATLIGLPVVAWIVLGSPLAFEAPVQGAFNFSGGLPVSRELTALTFGLVVYTAAFIGEVVRGGIQAVRRGQVEAALALGLTGRQTLRLVVFPQALRVIVPPLTSQYLNLAKNSSLAIAVGFADMFAVSRTMANQTGQPVSVIVLVMAAYLAISLVTSLLMNIYNRRVQVVER
ncbi:MAG: ABC transporter permease subunit [Chloroflexota bacterium]|nr:ABC transporter permease subunit [Chloroflexota bacterium]